VKYRIEADTLGEFKIPEDKYWGPQTQRSLQNFPIGRETIPDEVIEALAIIKKSAAIANRNLGQLENGLCSAICRAAEEIQEGKLASHFPLSVWQTGSGTQTNMNLNEVIANRCNELLAGPLVHPNDHVNRSQSSNDVFPSAIHVAAVKSIVTRLIPALRRIRNTFKQLETDNGHIIKIGRTHLQDATPITWGQEVSAWYRMMEKSESMIVSAVEQLKELAIGGTAVGTGLNAPAGFADTVVDEISQSLGIAFRSAENKFHALTSKDELVFVHGALKALAADLMKIANDVRWLASGPRAGIGEIKIPANEPGSSIMPGKVNPTQSEAVTMVVSQLFGNDVTIGFAASQGNFQLNVFMPVIAHNVMQSITLLADAITSFNDNCCIGIQANVGRMAENLENSLMLVTALNPYIGYDKAAAIAKHAYANNTTLRDAAVALGIMSGSEFDRIVKPENMV